jgi:hypothetical protein
MAIGARAHTRPITTWWRSAAGARLLGEFALLASGLTLYRLVRFLTRDRVLAAFANARRVLSIEHHLHIATELDLQRLVIHHPAVVEALNRYYAGVHFTSAATVLVLAYCVRRPVYVHLRRLFLGVTMLALVGHVAFPLAPPRMLGSAGFLDTMALFGPNPYRSSQVASVANQYAAMPSLHFAWSVLVAYGVIRCFRARGRWVAIAHPVITLFAIVATANHYWMDAVVAAALLGGVAAADHAWTGRQAARSRAALIPS